MGDHGCDCWECEERGATNEVFASMGSKPESVLDLAEAIRAKAGIIAAADNEADMAAALDGIASAAARMRAIL